MIGSIGENFGNAMVMGTDGPLCSELRTTNFAREGVGGKFDAGWKS